MSADFIEPLKKLQTKDASLLLMREQLLSFISQSTVDSEKMRTLLDELRLRYQQPSCQNYHNQAFYAALIGMAYFFLDENQEAINWFQTADSQFCKQGEVWNQCIALKILGLAYKSTADQYQAICTYEKAQRLLAQELRLHENDYGLDYQGLITNLDELIKNARLNPARAKKAAKPIVRASSKHSQANHPWPPAHIIYGVRDFGHANINPEFDSNDDQISEMSIDAISFDGVSHTVYNIRQGAGNQIKLTSTGNYRWLKVVGNSMNHATPIPFEPGDYALADLDQEPQFGNIVIANLHNSPTPAERAGVIKRYASKGLKSESIEQFDPIPLTDADIRGIVIAVAKKSTVPISPLSPDGEDCYETLLGMVAGDKSRAERLLIYEQQHSPHESREFHLREAIRRLRQEQNPG